MLRIHIRPKHLHHFQFVSAYPPVQDLLLACHGIEKPCITLFDHRDWEGIVLVADREDSLAITVLLYGVFFIVEFEKPLPSVLVGNRVPRGHDLA